MFSTISSHQSGDYLGVITQSALQFLVPCFTKYQKCHFAKLPIANESGVESIIASKMLNLTADLGPFSWQLVISCIVFRLRASKKTPLASCDGKQNEGQHSSASTISTCWGFILTVFTFIGTAIFHATSMSE